MVELSSSDEAEVQGFLPLLLESILGALSTLEREGDHTYFLRTLLQGSGSETGQAPGKGQTLLCSSVCQTQALGQVLMRGM